MTDSRITDGVGKKIVEALRMQSDLPLKTHNNELFNSTNPDTQDINSDNFNRYTNTNTAEPSFNIMDDNYISTEQNINIEQKIPETINIQIQPQMFNSSDLDDAGIPLNISILKQLLTKLPAGVTKQTGALIIRQTMEALGTSMRDVLKEAQQFQENLNSSTKECQATINEYKSQIESLEKQVRQYQKQYAMLNDIISLFVQVR